MTLIQMSVQGAVLILVIAAIRALTIDHLPKKTFMALWVVALERLLIPFSLPSSLSVYSLLRSAPPAAEETVLLLSEGTAVEFSADILIENVPRTISPWSVVWLCGAVALAVFFAASYWFCRRGFRTSIPVEDDFVREWLDRHPTRRGIWVRQSGAVTSPLTFGIWHPVILLPMSADLQDREALDYILTHEYVHIRRFDAITKLVIVTALCVHWFDPAVWIMYVLANRDMELACDETVIHIQGDGSRSAYARTLIRMEESKPEPAPLCSHFSRNALEERITAIMKTKKITLWTTALSALLVAGIAMGFATSAKAQDTADYAAILEGESSEDCSGPFTGDLEYWTAEEYEAFMEKRREEIQTLVGTENGWYDDEGVLHHWTQEIVDQEMAAHEEILRRIRSGKRCSKPVDIDTDGDGTPELSLSIDMEEPVTSVSVSYTKNEGNESADAVTENRVIFTEEDSLGAVVQLMKKIREVGDRLLCPGRREGVLQGQADPWLRG